MANFILQAKRFWKRKEIWAKSGSVDTSLLITSNNFRAREFKAFAQESTLSLSTQRTSTTSYSTWMTTTSKKWIILLNLHLILSKKHEKIPTFWFTVRQESQDAVLFWLLTWCRSIDCHSTDVWWKFKARGNAVNLTWDLWNSWESFKRNLELTLKPYDFRILYFECESICLIEGIEEGFLWFYVFDLID